ncbi:MAG: RecQ family ATP-dependent DNA helicase [Victivallaceae bacterium]
MHQTLEKHFGFNEFKAGQAEVIKRIISGQSAAAIFPTGSGKSLCYQLPALHLPNLTLVVSPLLALMQDQLDFLRGKGISAARIDSSLSRDEERQIMAKVRLGECKILLVAVERFKNERFRRFLSGAPISMMVIDEAHCISEWGHNFRPDYLKLPIYQSEFNVRQILLLTATATPAVIADMCAKYHLQRDAVIVTGFYRKNLRLWVMPVTSDKDNVLYELLKDAPLEPAIVYVTLQKTAETVADFLNGKGIHAVAYHAGMEHEDRERIQNSFMSGQINCIVATIAFGMGIDKSNIRRIIHYDMPKSIENYSQEIGRAGRDGKNSDCHILANLDNINVLENFIYGSTPEPDNIRQLLKRIPRNGSNWEFQLYNLSTVSNIRILTLKTLLVYLEMKGVIKPLYSYFSSYRYSNVISDAEIAAKFSGERRSFTDALFAGVKKSRIWSTVNFDEIKNGYDADRERVSTALEYFDQKGFIKLEAKEMTEVFEVTAPEFDVEKLTGELDALFRQKEQIEIGRIGEMVKLFAGDVCLSYSLATYFGEELEWKKCNHCSVCRDGKAPALEQSISLKPLADYNFRELIEPFAAKLPSPATAELITRFLCGITEPVLSKIKAKQLAAFGIFEKYRYADVRSWVQTSLKTNAD